MFASVAATAAEEAAPRPGDDILAAPDIAMDRAFTVAGAPAEIWPWLLQLGKKRAGWYLPGAVERFVPVGRRASRTVDARWLALQIGDVIPDYGGRNETFEVAEIDPPRALVYRSQRGRAELTWSISLEPVGRPSAPPSTRVFLG